MVRNLLFYFFIFLVLASGILLALPRLYKNTDKSSGETSVKKELMENNTGKRESLTKIEWIEIRDLDKFLLFSNLPDKLKTSELITSHNCESIVSSGFYTKSDKHIGLFYSQGKYIQKETENSFYNGYFTVLNERSVMITQKPVDGDLKFSIQSGPLLMFDGKALKQSISDDEPARRIVVGTNYNGKKAFLFIIYSYDNTILGPKLAELPDIIAEISDQNNLGITNALNLDGGSHSAFITKGVTISEILPVGGYFCIKP